MKFEQLKSSLQNEIFPIYLLEGEEDFFRDRGEELIKSAVVSEPILNSASFDGNYIKNYIDELINLLSSCPFMSERRAISVHEWYPTAQELKDKKLKNYFDSPFDTSVLIIVNSKKSDALKKLKSVTLVDCARGSQALITKFIRRNCTKAHMTISDSTCELITEYCLFDMTRINGEIEKLIAYKSGSSEITKDDVNLMVTKSSEYQIYEMVSFIANKDYQSAYKILDYLNAQGDRQMLFVSIYYHFRRMFFAAMSDKSDRELAEDLGVKEYAITMARKQTKSFKPKRLKKIMDKLSALEQGFKSGAFTFDSAFTLAVFNVLCE